MDNEYSIKLNFNTDMGQIATINIPKANENVTDEVVVKAMNDIISSNIVDLSAGGLISKKSAQLVTTATDEIDL